MESIECFATELADEFVGLDGDPRLERRSQQLLERWRQNPGLGFPEVFEDSADLEAAYRFFSNPNLSFELLLRAHSDKTLERCKQTTRPMLVVHDTSTFVFSARRDGLGFINKNNHGFLGHFAVAVTEAVGEAPSPLGVVAGSTWVREKSRASKPVPQNKLRSSEDCESHRWLNTVNEVEERFSELMSPLHIMDREADIYDCTSTMVTTGVRFVIRAKSNRIVESSDPEHHLLFDALDGLDVRYRDFVTVSSRRASKLPDQKRVYPDRDGREAHVCVSATTVEVKRTRNSSSEYPATTQLNVVHVFEPNPPEAKQPVEWILLTTEPISCENELRHIVECYRQRWIIEEFFKAIKTGCAFEKRQLGSYHALGNALAMTLPIAWNMLLLRAESRSRASLPASSLVDPLRLSVVRAHSKRYKLPDNPTLKDVAYAIAAMGGHFKRNGPPGWQTLSRGMKRLLTLEEGWIMARESCDQS